MFYVYILKSKKDGAEYVGLSKKTNKRLQDHNSGRVKTTKSKIPWSIIYTESYTTRIEARKREKYFKSAAGRRLRKKLRALSSAG